jgi:colanic acid/amylovoran biosynthesis protein
MKVAILNTCSTLNRGDAAIVLGQISLLQKTCPGVQIAITSKTPALDRAFYDPLGVEVLAPFTPALSVYQGAKRKVVEGARSLADGRNKKRLIQTLRRSDLVLSCGGGYFYSYRRILPGTTFWQNVIHARLATYLNKPLIFLPQSFGPFGSASAQKGVKRLLEKRNVLKVLAREEVSHRLLYRMLSKDQHSKIALCPDMAFYLEGNIDLDAIEGQPSELPWPILAMNLREWTFPEAGDLASRRSQRQEYLDTLCIVARFFLQRYRGSVMVVPQALGPDPTEDDRGICLEFCRRLRERIPADGVVLFRNPATSSLTGFMELLSQATLLIGARLHSCILAFLAGVPAISLGYQHKSQGTLDMLGLGRFNTSINALSSEWLLAAVEDIMNHHGEIQQEIRHSLRQARAQIEDKVGCLLESTNRLSRLTDGA